MDGCTADVQLPQSVLIFPARAQPGCSPLLSGFPVSSPPLCQEAILALPRLSAEPCRIRLAGEDQVPPISSSHLKPLSAIHTSAGISLGKAEWRIFKRSPGTWVRIWGRREAIRSPQMLSKVPGHQSPPPCTSLPSSFSWLKMPPLLPPTWPAEMCLGFSLTPPP